MLTIKSVLWRSWLERKSSKREVVGSSPTVGESEWDWLLNVTCNDISVIYITAHRCTGGLKKLDLQSGSQRYRHFVGSLTCPSKHRHGANLFMVIPRNRPILVAFYDTHGDTEDTFSTKPPLPPPRDTVGKIFFHFVTLAFFACLSSTQPI